VVVTTSAGDQINDLPTGGDGQSEMDVGNADKKCVAVVQAATHKGLD